MHYFLAHWQAYANTAERAGIRAAVSATADDGLIVTSRHQP